MREHQSNTRKGLGIFLLVIGIVIVMPFPVFIQGYFFPRRGPPMAAFAWDHPALLFSACMLATAALLISVGAALLLRSGAQS
jgi:purine-cytosine permease-like protein